SGRWAVLGDRNLSRLRPAAISAPTADAARSDGPTRTPEMWKAAPTTTAPAVWPRSLAVASMPPAAPDRWRGAEPTIVLLFGDWKRPTHIRPTDIRQAMWVGRG